MPLGSSNAAKSIFGQQIFNLLKKQAEKGNTLAQFKLGTFYEYGISVEKNSDVAKIWYKKAAKKKHTPAQDRLTYLDIKERGYNEYAHAEWFKKISSEAENEKANSLIILGQMHHNGIIVKKDLPVALNLLHRASLKSHAEVDGEIAEIQSKIDAENQVIPVKPTTKKNTRATRKTRYSQQKKTNSNASKKTSHANKNPGYKEAMLLEQNRQWSVEYDNEYEEDSE